MSQFSSSLFLAQSYQDAWQDYTRALTHPSFVCWDYVILTASNEQQAAGFRAQLKQRRADGMLPAKTHFAVIPDPEGKRVGSGGATLSVIRYIAEKTGSNDFCGLRILVIHSGGDSRRIPQYSALGKLFSPVPHELPNGHVSTLFDEFMIGMAGGAARIREGMLLLSGDVLLLFNPLQIDFSGDGAAVISFKEKVETGKDHGVFLRGADGNVARFLHKQNIEVLYSCGAVNERGMVDIDTGAVIFSAGMLKAFYGLISAEGCLDEKLYALYVNDTVRLSLYGDFLYPLAADSTLEDFYHEKPEGEYSEALISARSALWKALRPFRMKLLRLAPAKFIHFGTTREIMYLMSGAISEYACLGWDRCINSSIARQDVSGSSSVLSSEAVCGAGCYFEVSNIWPGVTVGENTLLSYVDVQEGTIPPYVVLHGLKQYDGRFVVRIYGVDDNPKGLLEEDCTFLSHSLRDFLAQNGIALEELWQGEPHSIWRAKLYPACETVKEAIANALNLYDMAQGKGNVELWRAADRKSLEAGFQEADPDALIAWGKRMQELVRMDRLVKLIKMGCPAAEAAGFLQTERLTRVQAEWLSERLASSDFGLAMRLHYYVGRALGGAEGEKYLENCFHIVRQAVLNGGKEKLRFNEECRIVSDSVSVSLPLRVNWGGGWSDTPPYCIEKGGTVINAAVLLNGRRPVEVTMTRLAEYKVVFDSRDMDVHGEFREMESLQETGNPNDHFALQKAALLACGIIPSEGGRLDEILSRMGGGFRMQTEVTGVPKGSGLGTSSILAAACVKAVSEFTGIAYDEDELYNHVLCMEQIMSTGGGWQDQVGGLEYGIKYITSKPGVEQRLQVQHVEVPSPALEELNQRFALIYTGQRRLARNLLRDVVGRYIGNEPHSLYALNEIQRVAALMRFELERGNVDAFTELLTRHWELSKKVDVGSTNTLIEQIFRTVDDMIDGKMICGAGGGGFLQVVLKKGVARQEVRERLRSVFQDSDIDVWDCTLV